jgi:aspartyl-tRNA(Asn)/glutamyl-tRNA(Gln) amidotransferase subunit C
MGLTHTPVTIRICRFIAIYNFKFTSLQSDTQAVLSPQVQSTVWADDLPLPHLARPAVPRGCARIFNLDISLDRAMKINREDVLKVAALANLELTDAEVETYRGQLDDILTYIDKLNEIDTSNVEPMAQVVAASADDSDLREDVVVRSDVITEVLSGAPDPEAPYFRVPRVIEK